MISRGFCIFNNAAVAVAAVKKLGAKRILVVDYDVHHGNGTESILQDDENVLFVSLHRHQEGKFYPYTGAASQHKNIINVPWDDVGLSDVDYKYAWLSLILPIITEYDPEIAIVSAGFDASDGDYLGRLVDCSGAVMPE